MFSHLALAFERHFNRIVSPPSAFRSWSWVQGNSQEEFRLLFFTYNENDVQHMPCVPLLRAVPYPPAWPRKEEAGTPRESLEPPPFLSPQDCRVSKALVITQLHFLISCKLCKSCAFFSWHIYIKFDSSCPSLSILELQFYISYSSFILPWGIYPEFVMRCQ